MRIATWNVNSVKIRMPRLLEWLTEQQPDVLCIQELKCPDDQFPRAEIEELGYEIHAHGDGRWNGVAILSRVGLEDPAVGFGDSTPAFEGSVETRAVAATCGGVRVWSLYVPNGRSPDNPHYAYKLEWLIALREAAAADIAREPSRPFALLGDFNIAPTDEDVWSTDAYSTHITEPERTCLEAIKSLGLVDVFPRPLKHDHPFTFWDYRGGDFHQNRGMRIDLVLANPELADHITDAWVDRNARKGKGPSDHAPVVIDTDLAGFPAGSD